jgi:hypothetical protein
MQPHLQLVLDGEYAIDFGITPKTVLDLGANVGAFAVWARERWPQARIICYEPDPRNVHNLRENAPFAEINAAAVGTFGSCRIIDGVNNCGETQVEPNGPIGCTHPSALPCSEIVKIDAEGSEVDILSGYDLSHTKWVVLEAHGDSNPSQCAAILNSKSFRLVREGWKEDARLMWFRRVEPINSNSLTIALPVYRTTDPYFMQSIARLQDAITAENFPWRITSLCGDALIGRSRNTLTADFLETDDQWLLQIDSDLVFSVEHIKTLLNANKKVVGGLYCKKQDGDVQWVVNALNESGLVDGPIQEVKYVGTGFLLAHRSVFTDIIEQQGDAIRYSSDGLQNRIEHDFWSVGPFKRDGMRPRYLSEDWFFCQRAKDCGHKIWCDTRVVLRHVWRSETVKLYPTPEQEKEIGL